MSDDTRSLRKALEDAQAALLDEKERTAALARERDETLDRERVLTEQWKERGQRIQALAAELDRLRAQARARTRAPEPVAPPSPQAPQRLDGPPRPPSPPAGAERAPSRYVRVKSGDARQAPPPPNRRNTLGPQRSGRVIVGGAAGNPQLPETHGSGRPLSTAAAQPAGCLLIALAVGLAALGVGLW